MMVSMVTSFKQDVRQKEREANSRHPSKCAVVLFAQIDSSFLKNNNFAFNDSIWTIEGKGRGNVSLVGSLA